MKGSPTVCLCPVVLGRWLERILGGAPWGPLCPSYSHCTHWNSASSKLPLLEAKCSLADAAKQRVLFMEDHEVRITKSRAATHWGAVTQAEGCAGCSG